MATKTVLHRNQSDQSQVGITGASTNIEVDEPKVRKFTIPESEELSAFLIVECTLRSEGFWACAAQLPNNTVVSLRSQRGRPAKNPPWVHFMMCLYVAAHGCGQREGIRAMRDSHTWNRLTATAHQYLPEGWRQATQPPTRENQKYFMRTMGSASSLDVLTRMMDAGRHDALKMAIGREHFDPEQIFDYDTLDKKQWITVDGCVFATAAKQITPFRNDESCGHYTEGGDTKTLKYGSKYAIAESISDITKGGLLLGFDHCTPKKGKQQGDEGASTIRLLTRMKQETPGIRGTTVDSVLRGTHIKNLLHKHMFVLNYPHAASNPNAKQGGRMAKGRIERSQFVKTVKHTKWNGHTCSHELYLNGSVLCQKVLNADGKPVLQPLTAHNVKTRTLKNGHLDARVEHTITCQHGQIRYEPSWV